MANRRNRKHQNEAQAKLLDTVKNLRDASLANEVSEKQQAGDRENDPQRRKSFPPRAFGGVLRHYLLTMSDAPTKYGITAPNSRCGEFRLN